MRSSPGRDSNRQAPDYKSGTYTAYTDTSAPVYVQDVGRRTVVARSNCGRIAVVTAALAKARSEGVGVSYRGNYYVARKLGAKSQKK